MQLRIDEKWIKRSIWVNILNIGYLSLGLFFWIPSEVVPLSCLVLLFNMVLAYILYNLLGD